MQIVQQFVGVTDLERTLLQSSTVHPEPKMSSTPDNVLQIEFHQPSSPQTSPERSPRPSSPVSSPKILIQPRTRTRQPTTRSRAAKEKKQTADVNLKSLQDACKKLRAQNKSLVKKLSAVETNSTLLESRVKALEQTVSEMREKENQKLQGIDKFLFEHFPTTYTAFQMGNYSDSTSRTISEHDVVSPETANTPEDVTHPKSAEESHDVVDNASNEITNKEGQHDAGELAGSVLIVANEITKIEALQSVLDIAKEINKPEDQQEFTEIVAKEKIIPEEAQNVVDIPVKELTKPDEEEDMGFASSSKTGIARRVQRRVGRKRKMVQSPFTTGARKKNNNLKVTTSNIEVDTNKEITEKVPAKSLDIIEVGTDSKIEARSAETALEYGGRTAISDEKRIFIDTCLQKYKDK
ncbi:hypothetical protein IEQ34_018962 [Dendrobium chrysotoxum]|uniref:Uncharacterized protein n=1 Tax=Dendrobium chrysotoxum TaxID=161865 RepID=A0AAV7G7D4_DENCH|nr:hypothetical protein IEQ34_018962 [Dendrobium chrysotoxum]